MKKQTKQTNEEYEHYKFLFEVTKKTPEKLYYSKLIGKYKDNAKKIGDIMKEIIQKTKTKTRSLHQRIAIGEKDIFDNKASTDQFNSYFINIGLNLASNVQSHKDILYEIF